MAISVDDLGRLVRGRIGLIIGPGVTHTPSVLSELSSHIATAFAVKEGKSYLDTGDAALEAGSASENLRTSVEGFLSKQPPAAVQGLLAKVRWSAVLSATFDLTFEDRLRQEYERFPNRHEVSVVSDLSQSIPPKTVPAFKLLGTLNRGDWVCSEADYLLKRATWRNGVKLFVDLVRDAPVLCLGISECVWLLRDLLVEMLGTPTGPTRHLLYLSEDSFTSNHVLTRLAANRLEFVPVNASLGQLVGAIETVQSAPSKLAPQTAAPDTGYLSLSRFSSFAVVVNQQLTSDVAVTERQRLHDLLFSPSVARWDPYAHGLDFPRTLSRSFIPELEQHLSTLHPDVTFAAATLSGNVASGKTVVFKRVAFALAQTGHLVLWLRPYFFQDSYSELFELFKSLARLKLNGRSVVVMMDDPLGFGTITPKAVLSAARSAGVSMLLCVAVRNSESISRDSDDITASLPIVAEAALSDALDDTEWAALPRYLVELGVEPDLPTAQQRVMQLETRSARDTLSMLYWLLPGTKPIIASAIKEELFRLGDTAGLTRVLIGVASANSQMLKDAYEMVAVSDNLDVPIPVEVLVSALGVGYSDWLEVANPKGPVWGLLYSDESEDGTTVVYQPRNAIVTNTIVNSLNGGTFSHTGEVRVLRRLLASCTGTQLVYRDYCVELLVKSKTLNSFDYSDGLALFDTALNALPYEDRTLLHHKGLWIKNKGSDSLGAERVLKRALEAKKYPYVARDESNEHIFTSLAATALDAIDQGHLTLEDGKAAVLDYLAKAKAGQWFNYKAVHVQANLISRLAAGIPVEHKADIYKLVSQAIADIDRTLLLLLNPLQDRLYSEQAIQLLQEVRERVLTNVGTLEEVKQDAQSQWEQHQRQDGFAVVARKLYERARQSNKGGDFKKAWDYCDEVIATVRAAERQPIAGIIDAALHVYYQWRVQRTVMHGSGAEIDWDLIRSWSVVMLQSGEPSAAFYRYTQAIALAHLSRWSDANALFNHLRTSGEIPAEILWTPRDFLLNNGGGRRQVQGTMRRGASKMFLHVESLETDFHVDRGGYWPEDGEVTNAYIRFAFAGATAVHA